MATTANAADTVDPDTLPTVKQNICFADTLNIATQSLNNGFSEVDGFDTANKLMLFGVDDWNDPKSFATAFKNNHFEELELFGCDLNAAAAKALADGLSKKGGAKIKSLELDNSPMDVNTAKTIIESVSQNKDICYLNLQGSVKTLEALQAMATALRGNKYIKKLDLKINNINPTGAESLASMFKLNKVLLELDLFYNEVGKGGAESIANALIEDQCALKIINLCCNKVGDEGATALSRALKVNRTLVELHLALNDIKDNGAEALCDALNPVGKRVDAVSENFKFLDISANVIGYEGSTHIASLLAHTRTLEHIDFTGIEPTPEGWERMISAFVTINTNAEKPQVDMTGKLAEAMQQAADMDLEKPLQVKFSIVDIDDESLEAVEIAIAGNPNIDYKRINTES